MPTAETQRNADTDQESGAEKLARAIAEYTEAVMQAPGSLWSPEGKESMYQWAHQQTDVNTLIRETKNIPRYIQEANNIKQAGAQKYQSLDWRVIAPEESLEYQNKLRTETMDYYSQIFGELNLFERYKEMGLEQTKRFEGVITNAKGMKLLASDTERAAIEKYKHAFFKDRDGIITELTNLVAKREGSLQDVFNMLDDLKPELFTRSAVATMKQQFAAATPEQRREYKKNFPKIIGTLSQERAEKARQYHSKMGALKAEGGIGDQEATELLSVFDSSSAEERSRLDHIFEHNANKGRENRDLFYTKLIASTKSPEEKRRLTGEFREKDWGDRKRMVMDFESGRAEEEGSSADDPDKGFKRTLKRLATTHQARYSEFRQDYEVAGTGTVKSIDTLATASYGAPDLMNNEEEEALEESRSEALEEEARADIAEADERETVEKDSDRASERDLVENSDSAYGSAAQLSRNREDAQRPKRSRGLFPRVAKVTRRRLNPAEMVASQAQQRTKATAREAQGDVETALGRDVWNKMYESGTNLDGLGRVDAEGRRGVAKIILNADSTSSDALAREYDQAVASGVITRTTAEKLDQLDEIEKRG